LFVNLAFISQLLCATIEAQFLILDPGRQVLKKTVLNATTGCKIRAKVQ